MLLRNLLKGKTQLKVLWLVSLTTLFVVRCTDQISERSSGADSHDERLPSWDQLDTLILQNGDKINRSHLDSASMECEFLLKACEDEGYEVGKAKVLNNMGLIAMYEGKLVEATELLTTSNTMCKAHGFSDGQATAMANMAIIFDILGQYDKALKASRPVVVSLKKKKKYDLVPVVYANMSTYHNKLGNKDSATYYSKLCYESANVAGVSLVRKANYRMDWARLKLLPDSIESFIYHASQILNDIQEDESAARYELEARAYRFLIPVLPDTMSRDTLEGIARRLHEIEDKVQMTGLEQIMPRAYAAIYTRLGDPVKAAEYEQQTYQIKDSLYSPAVINKVTTLFHAMELNNERAELIRLEQQFASVRTSTVWVISTLGGLLAVFLFFFVRYKTKHSRHERKLEKEAEQERLKAMQLDEDLTKRQRELERLRKEKEKLNDTVHALEHQQEVAAVEDQQLATISKLRSSKILTSEQWEQFKVEFEMINTGLFYRLRDAYPDITHAEERLFCLLRLNMSSAELSSALGVSPAAVKKSRQRLRKRLGLSQEQRLEDFVSSF